jgi:hypothetical protein
MYPRTTNRTSPISRRRSTSFSFFCSFWALWAAPRTGTTSVAPNSNLCAIDGHGIMVAEKVKCTLACRWRARLRLNHRVFPLRRQRWMVSHNVAIYWQFAMVPPELFHVYAPLLFGDCQITSRIYIKECKDETKTVYALGFQSLFHLRLQYHIMLQLWPRANFLSIWMVVQQKNTVRYGSYTLNGSVVVVELTYSRLL